MFEYGTVYAGYGLEVYELEYDPYGSLGSRCDPCYGYDCDVCVIPCLGCVDLQSGTDCV